jgi:DNA-binding NtrC family response regulator
MEARQNRERTRVMIVDPEVDFGMKLADWLAAHGYQPVFVRTVDAAIDEMSGFRPQAVFIGLQSLERRPKMDAFEALLLIQTICPHVPVITIADQASEDFAQLMVRQGVRRFLVRPVEFSQIGHVIESELNATAA